MTGKQARDIIRDAMDAGRLTLREYERLQAEHLQSISMDGGVTAAMNKVDARIAQQQGAKS